MAVRKVIIERNETRHSVATLYATVFDNGLVDIRSNNRSKLDPAPDRSTDEADRPENRLTTEQLRWLVGQLGNGSSEDLRRAVDEAIDAWLEANGVDEDTRNNLDYSYIDNVLNDLLTAEA